MKPAWSNSLWALAGSIFFTSLIVLGLRTRLSSTTQLQQKLQRLELVTRMRAELAAESEAEKSAVLATSDADSRKFADQARAQVAEIRNQQGALEPLLISGRERELSAAFARDFDQLVRVDEELLDLAVKNSNLKASALAHGPAQRALEELDAAVERLLASPDRRIWPLAARVQSGALHIALLLAPHIAEESDARMDDLEKTMSHADAQVRKQLAELQSLLPSNPDVKTATDAYARFSQLRTQILALSRQNTNVRSLSLSLHQKRTLMLMCADDLAALDKTISAEPIATSRPR